jgi:hypothetical protein
MIEQVPSLRRALPLLAQRSASPSRMWRRGRCKAPGMDALLACLRDTQRVSA